MVKNMTTRNSLTHLSKEEVIKGLEICVSFYKGKYDELKKMEI